MNITTLGIDIAKEVFQLHGVDERGQKVMEKRLKRAKFKEYMAKIKPCRVVMEACGSANFWARELKQYGHKVDLISPQYVKPFVQGNKNDYRDAAAIVEASSRPSMHYVEPKTIEQQNIQSLLRIREGYIEMRTKLCNQIRGLLSEYGIIIRVGINYLRKKLVELTDRNLENNLSFMLKQLLEIQYASLLLFDQHIAECDIHIARIARKEEACRRLQEIEGVGIITAVAMIAAVGDGKGFKNGRHFAAFLGLVPSQDSSGGREKLLGISKRGNAYLRKLFIHGGRSMLIRVGKKTDPRSQWAKQLKERRGMNRAAVAIANKNARIAMAMLLNNDTYKKAA